VLSTQSHLFQARHEPVKARQDMLAGNLPLRAANGTLKAENLGAVNGLSAK
jgi:outer membrane protein